MMFQDDLIWSLSKSSEKKGDAKASYIILILSISPKIDWEQLVISQQRG